MKPSDPIDDTPATSVPQTPSKSRNLWIGAAIAAAVVIGIALLVR